MGNKQSRSSSSISTDSYVREVRHVRKGMSDRDRRLYNYARIKIAEEDLEDVEITVGFEDQDAVVLQGVNNPSGKVYIGLDYNDIPQLVWKKRGFWRSVKRFFIGCFSTLKRVLLSALSIGASEPMKAITFG
ncbi:uncharacterized protein LOC132732874 [Ruditapes philippinarum]|uniref:uncharacterized protein LOC132732874 n=1 Tax=Ruditapes philippinarum TaxID=129788 RepID=UPI00295AC776|nr:uncharacterized protein LOC132732874 [Ruditapes philippinarum]XP_060575383.1 uncharacterized protein LOC132732874 [Ruditapes philippinarum]